MWRHPETRSASSGPGRSLAGQEAFSRAPGRNVQQGTRELLQRGHASWWSAVATGTGRRAWKECLQVSYSGTLMNPGRDARDGKMLDTWVCEQRRLQKDGTDRYLLSPYVGQALLAPVEDSQGADLTHQKSPPPSTGTLLPSIPRAPPPASLALLPQHPPLSSPSILL